MSRTQDLDWDLGPDCDSAEAIEHARDQLRLPRRVCTRPPSGYASLPDDERGAAARALARGPAPQGVRVISFDITWRDHD